MAHSNRFVVATRATRKDEKDARKTPAAVCSCAPDSFFGGLRAVLSFRPYLLLMGSFIGVGLGLLVPPHTVFSFLSLQSRNLLIIRERLRFVS